jgi:hypothetical protein
MDKPKFVLVFVMIALLTLAVFLSFFGMDVILRIGQQSLSIN